MFEVETHKQAFSVLVFFITGSGMKPICLPFMTGFIKSLQSAKIQTEETSLFNKLWKMMSYKSVRKYFTLLSTLRVVIVKEVSTCYYSLNKTT